MPIRCYFGSCLVKRAFGTHLGIRYEEVQTEYKLFSMAGVGVQDVKECICKSKFKANVGKF